MRRQKEDGFVMIQVLILIMVILLFLTSLFANSGFRHRRALMRIQKEEARCAAEAALKLMETEIENGNTEWMEGGLERTEILLEFESEDGETRVKIPVDVWAEYENDEIHLFAEAEVGVKKEKVHSTLELPERPSLITDSNAEIATSSTASQSERKEHESE